MPYCPDCGRHIALGDTACPECGRSLGDGAPDGGRNPAGDPAGVPPGSGGGPPRRPDSESLDDPGERAPTRRRALAYAGGVLGAMVAGTFALERLGGDGPAEVVDAWRTAWAKGDVAAFRGLFHPDSDRAEAWMTDGDPLLATPDASLQYLGEERDVLERTDTRASVRDVFVLGHPGFEIRRRVSAVVDLRIDGDEWRIWDDRIERSERVDDCTRSFTITGMTRIDCE